MRVIVPIALLTMYFGRFTLADELVQRHSDGRWVYVPSNTTPCVLHFNGHHSAKVCARTCARVCMGCCALHAAAFMWQSGKQPGSSRPRLSSSIVQDANFASVMSAWADAIRLSLPLVHSGENECFSATCQKSSGNLGCATFSPCGYDRCTRGK